MVVPNKLRKKIYDNKSETRRNEYKDRQLQGLLNAARRVQPNFN